MFSELEPTQEEIKLKKSGKNTQYICVRCRYVKPSTRLFASCMHIMCYDCLPVFIQHNIDTQAAIPVCPKCSTKSGISSKVIPGKVLNVLEWDVRCILRNKLLNEEGKYWCNLCFDEKSRRNLVATKVDFCCDRWLCSV